MGGGNGLSALLRGLKRYVKLGAGAVEITAVVTVTDDGGSSGRLRREFDILPPGDIRNCMVALSEDEHLLSRLFQHRFSQGDLGGHNFGNLFLAALTEVSGGVTLQSIGDYAAVGPDRISVGALTHSALALDLGLDLIWRDTAGG